MEASRQDKKARHRLTQPAQSEQQYAQASCSASAPFSLPAPAARGAKEPPLHSLPGPVFFFSPAPLRCWPLQPQPHLPTSPALALPQPHLHQKGGQRATALADGHTQKEAVGGCGRRDDRAVHFVFGTGNQKNTARRRCACTHTAPEPVCPLTLRVSHWIQFAWIHANTLKQTFETKNIFAIAKNYFAK